MSRPTRETQPPVVETEKIKPRDRSRIYFYLAMIMLSLTILGETAIETISTKYFKGVEAITTPFGILYFTEPDPWLREHEQCHQERLQEVGPIEFYGDYLTGGACAEELRCGAPASHPACTEYPLSQVP